MTLTAADAQAFERCMSAGGVAVLPTDTVYGLACEPATRDAVARMFGLKGRPANKPAAVMFFDVELALAALPEAGPRTHAALAALLPGALTVLVPNPRRRFPLACLSDLSTLGLRVPALAPALAALGEVRWPVLQTSANLAGQEDPRTIEDVRPGLRRAADLVLDGGPLPGTPSTVLDLRAYEFDGVWSIVREGAVAHDALAAVLDG